MWRQIDRQPWVCHSSCLSLCLSSKCSFYLSVEPALSLCPSVSPQSHTLSHLPCLLFLCLRLPPSIQRQMTIGCQSDFYGRPIWFSTLAPTTATGITFWLHFLSSPSPGPLKVTAVAMLDLHQSLKLVGESFLLSFWTWTWRRLSGVRSRRYGHKRHLWSTVDIINTFSTNQSQPL